MALDTIYNWSQTAASNATADDTINFAEFQKPSSLNDSCRALMARIAQFLSDAAPNRTSTGSANAYAVASDAAGATLTNCEQITFIPHASNTSTCTLDVDGRGAKAWRPAPSVEFEAGNILEGVPVTAYYRSSTDEWLSPGTGYYVSQSASGVSLQSITARLPQIGDLVVSYAPTPGAGRIRLTEATQTFLKSAYPELNSYLSGISYPWGSTSTTFSLPPAAGYFLRFAGTTSAIDTSGARTAGSTQSDQNKAHTHTVSATGTTNNTGGHTHGVASVFISSPSSIVSAGGGPIGSFGTAATDSSGAHDHTVTATGTAASSGGDEARVKNVAFHVDVVASTALAASQLAVFGFPFTWDTGTSDANPGTARLRIDNATIASATYVYISTTDGWGVTLSGVYTAFTNNSIINISKVGAQANRLTLYVSGSPVAGSGYYKIPVMVLSSGGAFSSGDQVAFEFSLTSADSNVTAAAAQATAAAASAVAAAASAASAASTVATVNTAYTATYSALQALTAGSKSSVYVGGRASEGDRGGGTFRWVSGNQSAYVTADPSKGIYVPPSSDLTGASGVWARTGDFSEVNVCWFGALGDNSSNDTSAINAALLYCQTYLHNLYFPDGTYLTDGIVHFPASIAAQISIRGDGSKVTRIKKRTSTAGILFTVGSAASTYYIGTINISGITFDGKDSTTAYTFAAYDMVRSTIRDCDFVNGNVQAIFLGGIANTIQSCSFDGGAIALMVISFSSLAGGGSPNLMEFSHCRLINATTRGGYVSGGNMLTFYHCDIEGNGTTLGASGEGGMYVHTDMGSSVSGSDSLTMACNFDNCWFEGNKGVAQLHLNSGKNIVDKCNFFSQAAQVTSDVLIDGGQYEIVNSDASFSKTANVLENSGASSGNLIQASNMGNLSVSAAKTTVIGGEAGVFTFPSAITVAAGTATPAGGSTAARLLLGTTAGFGIYYGSGAPTVSAGKGSLYLRSDGSSTSTRSYVNTDGGTTWTNHVTAA